MHSNSKNTLLDQIDSCLPQTQCTRCGYPYCRDYATAILDHRADINQCPPGGDATINALAQLLKVAPKPLNPRFGQESPRTRAIIDERWCIGCRKCIDVCPTDAIVGAPKLMHTVLTDECTGCALCLPPCPVDCITLTPVASVFTDSLWPEYGTIEVERWRTHTERRLHRLLRDAVPAITNKLNTQDTAISGAALTPVQIRSEIQAAVERVRRRRVQRNRTS